VPGGIPGSHGYRNINLTGPRPCPGGATAHPLLAAMGHARNQHTVTFLHSRRPAGGRPEQNTQANGQRRILSLFAWLSGISPPLA